MTEAIRQNGERAYRICLALFGGYAFTAGYVALIGVLLHLGGLSKVEAITIAYVNGMVVYIAVAVWAIATTALWRATAIITAVSFLKIIASPALMIGSAP